MYTDVIVDTIIIDSKQTQPHYHMYAQQLPINIVIDTLYT